jgi:hypothetical protein
MSASRRLAVLASLAVVLLAPGATSASHAWGNYHWARTANPFTLQVGDNVSSAWDAYLDEAIADWSQSNVLDLAKASGGTRAKNCRPTAGRIEACSARYGNNGWLGLAQIWAQGSHITQAVTKVNDTYFASATYNTPAWRRLVMCQELAHDFGLAHQDETFDNANLGSCMDYTNDPDGGPGGASSTDPSNEHPNSHDFQQIASIYSHTDSSTTIGAAAPGKGGKGAGSGAWHAEFGREVAQLAGGRVSVYVLDLGAGQRVITHVIWA